MSKKNDFPKSQRGVYLDDRVWAALEKKAGKEDRSINYVIEKLLVREFNISK